MNNDYDINNNTLNINVDVDNDVEEDENEMEEDREEENENNNKITGYSKSFQFDLDLSSAFAWYREHNPTKIEINKIWFNKNYSNNQILTFQNPTNNTISLENNKALFVIYTNNYNQNNYDLNIYLNKTGSTKNIGIGNAPDTVYSTVDISTSTLLLTFYNNNTELFSSEASDVFTSDASRDVRFTYSKDYYSFNLIENS